jgi:hypothetical protein
MAENDMALYQQLDSLPNSLRFGAKQLQVRIARTTNLLPIGQDSANSNGSAVVRFRFPSASIVNLSSATVSFQTTISNLVVGSAGSNFINALIPASYKYIRRAQFFLGGISVSGSLLNNYNQVFHAMVKATANNQYTNSKVIEGYTEVSELYDQYGYLNVAPVATTKTAYQQIDDFLLLARGNGNSSEMFIDSSIFNDLELQLDFDNNSILSIYADGTATNNQAQSVAWALSNMRLNVDVISSIPPIYSSFIELRASQNSPIRLCYQNLVSQVQLAQSTTRIQVSSTCIDGVMVCALPSNYNSTVAFTGNVLTTQVVQATNPPKFNFNSGLTDSTAQSGFSAIIQLGTANYPTTAYSNAYLLADSTMNHFWGASIAATCLLYQKTNIVNTSSATTAICEQDLYQAPNFLTQQFIWVQSFSLEDGWSSSQKVLSGVDTSSTSVDLLVITNGIADGSRNLLMVGLLTSVLEYDTIAKRVRVIQ